MPTAAWWRRFEGDSASLAAGADGSIIVSTYLEHWLTSAKAKTRETLLKARYVITPAGAVEQRLPSIQPASQASGGARSAADAPRDTYGVVGAGPWTYALSDHHLHRYDANGVLSAKMPIERTLFDSYLRDHPELEVARFAKLDDRVRLALEPQAFPPSFDLHHDHSRRRLIASNWSRYAWIMALDFDGRIEWLTLVSESCCCNLVCLAGDTIVHASGCSARLSFLTATGTLTQVHEFARDHHPHDLKPDAQRGVCVTFTDRVCRYDEHGELTWTIEASDLRTMLLHDGMLYIVHRKDPLLELLAYRLA